MYVPTLYHRHLNGISVSRRNKDSANERNTQIKCNFNLLLPSATYPIKRQNSLNYKYFHKNIKIVHNVHNFVITN